jgi:2-keto-4-pentenoate hydratase
MTAPAAPDFSEAARLLLGHRRQRTTLAQLPETLRPRTRADGYAIQAGWMQATSSPLYGWKIAATSEAGQRHINVDGPLAGRMLAEMILPDGATVSLAGNRMRVTEVELAFRMGADLAPRARRYEVDEVMAAVASLHPSIEIPDSRYDDFCAVGAPQLIADNACTNLFVIGAATDAPWRDAYLAAHRVLAVVNGTQRHDGQGRNVLGDPRIALAWLVNELSSIGVTLAAGQVVTTGTCLVPILVAPGDEVRASYGGFGELSVRFVA